MTNPDFPALIVAETGQTHRLHSTGRLTIGRKSDNSIVLPVDDLRASRYHCIITWEDSDFVLEDVGSANGTFLNGVKIRQPQPLKNGDEISVGATVFQVSLPLPDTRPRLAPSPESAVIEATIVGAPPVDQDDTQVRSGAAQFNPYVGPRTFSRQESDRFFGREVEARELMSLVISERLVLFYAQSGAGKSSLINTRLIPQLQTEGYAVLPIGRVSGELPKGMSQVQNIYIFNLLLSMDESDGDPSRFTQMSLRDFLTRLTSLDGTHYFYDDHDLGATEPSDAEEEFQAAPYVLLIDQFEEIVTAHPTRWQEREDFFRQLAEAMAYDPYLWVVLSLREDYVASLDPYASLLPGHLRARFYMQRMSYEAALEAVKKPAEQFDRSFTTGVAENLVDNLRQIRVYGPDGPEKIGTRSGQFVEPVQLQVVCYQLWEKLKSRPGRFITQQDLDELGDVNQALAQFYEQALADVISQTDVTETELRNWFQTQLITEAGTRGTVYRGRNRTGGIDNRAVDILVGKFLLRSEVRAGGTWYELVHDRFIEPILQSNQAWQVRQPLIKMAQDWDIAGRPPGNLLEGHALQEALATNWRSLGPLVGDYLTASSAAREDREQAAAAEKLRQAQELAEVQQRVIDEQKRAAARLRRRAMWITGFAILAVLMAIGAVFFGWLAQQSLTYARSQADYAAEQAATADSARATAVTSQEESESARQDAQQQAIAAQTAEADAEKSLDFAIASQATAVVEATAAANARATAEAGSTAAAANAAEARRLLEIQQATQTAEAELSSLAVAELEATRVALEATVAAQEATRNAPTPTATATPQGGRTPSAGATATSLPTDTPTPDATATANVEKLNAITSQDAVIGCKIQPDASLATLAEKYQSRLGCPVAAAVGGEFAEQPFQNGFMIWTGIYQEIYAMVGDTTGYWAWFDKETTDSYGPSDEGSCTVRVPSGLVQPVRGFGAVWCANPELAKDIGFGTKAEYGVGNNLIQKFEDGVMIRDSLGQVYALFNNGMSYVREKG